MAKKKKTSLRTGQLGGSEDEAGHVAPSPSAATPASPSIPAALSDAKPSPARGLAKCPQPATMPASPLIISRNKHWRYIASFHGPWLQLPPEMLDMMAHIIYNSPHPRPVEPSHVFDLLKIRRLVDEATDQAVRAASGVASSNHHAPTSPFQAAAFDLGIGSGPGQQVKLSRERIHRMREQASHKLARAYRLDEVACSVATMQSASPVEEVARLVLQRSAHDVDAQYVHFFHDKIPSRQLAESTSLDPLNNIIAARPSDPEHMRTRALVRMLKADPTSAIHDLTEALQLHRLHRPHHTAPRTLLLSHQQTDAQSPLLQPYEADQHRGGRRQGDTVLKDEDQPSSLELQLLFQRGMALLSVACQAIAVALAKGPGHVSDSEKADAQASGEELASQPYANGLKNTLKPAEGPTEDSVPEPPNFTPPPPSPSLLPLTPHEEAAEKSRLGACKSLRVCAKKALRDFMGFLSFLEYSPDLPIEVTEEFMRRINQVHKRKNSQRTHLQRSASSGEKDSTSEGASQHRVYVLSDLLQASAVPDLPPYPSTDLVVASRAAASPTPERPARSIEAVTFHPMLSEVLHSVLLCHCLMQTSPKELQRHAYTVARITRLADGFPLFQSSRSPARVDWIEVLRAAGKKWMPLNRSWDELCAPAPPPPFEDDLLLPGGSAASLAAMKPTPLLAPGGGGPTRDATEDFLAPSAAAVTATREDEQRRRARLHHQLMLDALSDERVTDDASLRVAVRARQMRAESDLERLDEAAAALELDDKSRTGRLLEGNPDSPATGSTNGADETRSSNSSFPVEMVVCNAPLEEASGGNPGVQEPMDVSSLADSPAASTPSTPQPPAVPSATDTKTLGVPKKTGNSERAPTSDPGHPDSNDVAQRAVLLDGTKDYQISTERAAAVIRWVLEASPNAGLPPGSVGGEGGVRRRRKKPAALKKPPLDGDEGPDSAAGGETWMVGSMPSAATTASMATTPLGH